MRFERIAPRYDLTNSVLSLGLHRRWKRLLIRSLALRPGGTLLDAGTGTGDLALLAASHGARVVGVDLSARMLGIAARRIATANLTSAGGSIARAAGPKIWLVRGDLSGLPLATSSVTAVASAFVLRHLPHLHQVFQEFRRVLAPGGRVAILEFGRPAPWLRPIYDALSVTLIPLVGGLLTGDREAYRFLVRSIRTFPEPSHVAAVMTEAGFDEVRWRPIDAGIAVLYVGSAHTGPIGSAPTRK
jgi:demethylmenaquinone methyltransferase/2-methoxy-6-polyprenyl-1,4-benzoquinol methylase